MKCGNYFLGLDIGTDSVGYAVSSADGNYTIPRINGNHAWGVTLFEGANLSNDRRAFRSARRRLDRRQQRVKLIQELFAKEIAKTDETFFRRIKESGFAREDSAEPYSLFNDEKYTDTEYHKEYPTIHHLICDLIDNKAPHDVRLVYIACAWLVAHRGHFLLDIADDNIGAELNLQKVYNDLISYFENLPVEGEYISPWETPDMSALENVLKKKMSVTLKTKELTAILFGEKKPPKSIENPESFPFSSASIIKLLAGGTVKLKDLYGNEGYDELGSFSLGKSDEDYDAVLRELGDDGELLIRLKTVYDWEILADLQGECKYISQKKVKIYGQHKSDLKTLKYFVKKYIPEKYNDIFKSLEIKGNYVSYSGNIKNGKGDISKFKECKKSDFCAYILSCFKNITADESDTELYSNMLLRLNKDVLTFMPKQVEDDNRVIPYQLYFSEMRLVLENAAFYLPFLNETDRDGYITKEKILSVMKFRVPYYVGPLNSSKFGWIEKKSEGKIYPWNFEEKVDLDKSEQRFIAEMTNSCSYLPDKDVLPKHSLLYEKFEVLNEINNIKILDRKISVEAKQCIYNELFMKKKKVTLKMIRSLLVANGFYSEDDVKTMSGIDETVKSSLSSHNAFSRLISSGVLSEDEAERIIMRSTYSESKSRFRKYLKEHFGKLSDGDFKYVASLKFKDFGRLSRELLCEFNGSRTDSGEYGSVMYFMWNYNVNLSELLLSETEYTFRNDIADYNKEYYSSHPLTLSDRLDEMYVSNAVKRPIFRTLDIVSDVTKAMGKAPRKIFVEMARGAAEEQKGKRTKSRKAQIEELYAKVKNEDVKKLQKQLEDMGDAADSRLQSEALFLYYMQLGKCMYTGEAIDITRLKDGTYNIEHIYPRSKVKDDSILNNKVLVLSKVNGEKSDTYPIPAKIRTNMQSFWKSLLNTGLITEEKYKRLVRATPFTDEEKWGFINRQLVETRQSTKVVTQLLSEMYPDTETVYVKAGLVSDFRQEYGLIKSRAVNDLHHAKDAYLNIVCGNVYHELFTRKWYIENSSSDYSVKTSAVFGVKRYSGGDCIWNGSESVAEVKKTVSKNSVHMTAYSFCRKGGLFDQMPVKAKEGLIPRKASLPTGKYGGYNRPTVSFFVIAKYKAQRKEELMLVPVELMYLDRYMSDEETSDLYIMDRIGRIIGKPVDGVSYPAGKRPIKINTLFSFDGFLCTLSGTSSGGKCVIMAPFMPLAVSAQTERYIKYIEQFCKKCDNNVGYLYDEKYDNVSPEKNIEIYELLLDKLQNSIFAKRPNVPTKTVEEGFERFKNLDIKSQSKALLNLIGVFGRISGGIDLSLIDGAPRAAATGSVSSTFSNWKKNYSEVYIIDRSASGIWEKKSRNLLDFV